MFALHLKDKKQFVDSVNLTAQHFSFAPWVVEKDYFCSLLLKSIFEAKGCNLVFKGGTLLNKVHASFYRLSEDLDFSIDTKPADSRSTKKIAARQAKACIEKGLQASGFKLKTPFSGYNENQSYRSIISYPSFFLNQQGSIKVEFTLFEKVLDPTSLKASTLLVDCLSFKPVIAPFDIVGYSLTEAYAEKIRAALSRTRPAIRDLFDVQYAIKNQLIQPNSLMSVVKKKLQAMNRKTDTSSQKKTILQAQLHTDLKPVLRPHDFEDFDFNKAWQTLIKLEQQLLK